MSETMEMLNLRTELKESKERQNRIASGLKTYYDDLMSAKDVPMNLELGEIIRDEILEVFKVLKENGIKLD